MAKEEQEDVAQEDAGVRGQASRDMNKVAAIGEDSAIMDQVKLTQALGVVQKCRETSSQKQQTSVKLDKSDVELVMKEFDMSKPLAEKALREHNGDIKECLRQLVLA